MKNLKTILSNIYGIETNKWVKLNKVITKIQLNEDAAIYPSDNELYYFDTTDNTLLISKNYKYSELTTINSNLNAYPITSVFDASNIISFNSTLVMGPGGIYMDRPF